MQVDNLFKPMEKNKEKVKLETVAEAAETSQVNPDSEASNATGKILENNSSGVMNSSGDEKISAGPGDDLRTLELEPGLCGQVP